MESNITSTLKITEEDRSKTDEREKKKNKKKYSSLSEFFFWKVINNASNLFI